jgi:hypothetical protein
MNIKIDYILIAIISMVFLYIVRRMRMQELKKLGKASQKRLLTNVKVLPMKPKSAAEFLPALPKKSSLFLTVGKDDLECREGVEDELGIFN